MRIKLGKLLSRETVSRRLVEQKLLARATVVKPLISSKNKKCRLAFANEHVSWSQEKWQMVLYKKCRLAFANDHVSWSQEKWQMVLFSDESKFLLIGSDRKTYVRRKVGKELWPKPQTGIRARTHIWVRETACLIRLTLH